MKKKQQILATIIILVTLTFFGSTTYADDHFGDFYISDSSDLVLLSGFTGVSGSLHINSTTLTSLVGLENLISVGGDLGIYGNTVLTSLSGLENITSVDQDIRIDLNDSLTSHSGLENLTSVGMFLSINGNAVLTSLSGLEGLASVGEWLEIRDNDALTNLCALYNINLGGDLSIIINNSLSMDTAYALEAQLISKGFTGTSDIHDNNGSEQVFCGPGREIYGNVFGDIQEGVTVTIYIVSCGAPQPHATVTTDAQGYYSVGNLQDGRYLIVPEDANYTFDPKASWVDIPQEEIQPYDFTSLAVETVTPFMPIAICDEALIDSSGSYNCNIGRVFNDNNDTARWTNFEGCDGAVSSSSVSQLIDCDAGANPDPIGLGSGMATTNSIMSTASYRAHDCFIGNGTEPPRILEWTLPVIECDSAPTCGGVIGTVNVDIVWITYGSDPDFSEAPTELYSADGEQLLWQSNPADIYNGIARWVDFVEHFNLQDVQGGETEPAELYNKMSIYFVTSCDD